MSSYSHLMKKRGQITIFVILGLVILISALMFFVLKGTILRKEIAPGVSMIVEELPNAFLPIKPYVEKCLEKTAKQGIIIAGQRGGYIYTDSLRASDKPTEGDAVRFSKQSELIVPYWFYLSSGNKCTGSCDFDTKKLWLKSSAAYDSVEGHLSRYIDENIGSCIGDFKSIKELGFDIEAGKPKTKVIIAEKNIVVQLDYPITASRQGSKTELRNFYIDLDLNLNSIYRLADYITELEEKYRFLEKATLNLIVGFSGIDKDKLPPMSDSSFELSSKVSWRKSNVKGNVKNILVSYIPLLRLAGSANWQEIDTGNLYTDRLYNYGMSIPNNVSINSLGISFNYLDFWDIYFDLNCNGESCEPESGFTDLLPIGMQRYNFAYDVSYPVLVEIEDASAFNGQGYTFDFMLESNIRNNRAMPAVFEPLVAETEEGSMLCEENKRTSGEIRIEAVNSLNNELLDGVDVIYSCIESCYIGTVNKGILETAFPLCFGGVVSFRKDGFETKYVRFDTSLGKSGEIKVKLNPKKEMKVRVMKKVLDGDRLSGGISLDEYETAYAVFRKNMDDIDRDFSMLNVSGGSEDVVSLAEGQYEIEINVIAEKELYLPPEKREFSGQEVHIPELNMSSYVSGRARVNYTFTKEDIAGDRITLYAIAADFSDISSIDELEVTGRFDDYSKKYYHEIMPEIG